ncbi:glycoside hydrolase family 5 protein [Didymella exigua CBS 183.55]|uniref:glucan 1,3-beta-glucosidase n=1 Tax=Didymella exigua CBS 183.55 TaxID=1150837 RepID=A0A6A5RTD0_9PLEO|nr:glycoside hydrolase family 5 protein [Didymella exigua CBS 183.55]KAF1931745.1 glycoside hydrolase family 5 protein [Didymella exigua CBS 183.55]
MCFFDATYDLIYAVRLLNRLILCAVCRSVSKALNRTSSPHKQHKIRGVNLGSLFIVEPWMSSATWKSMGCGDAKSEWDCVASLGQEKADTVFQKYWNTFITADDFDKMKDYGLNTVRIPIGHWFVEETIIPDEKWPKGGMRYLDKVAELAASRNISVIIDLHGGPGVQVPNNAFTGHTTDDTRFYTLANYARAYTFLRNITERIHTHTCYSSTFMLEVLNEPESNHDTLVSNFYPNAYSTIRSVEADLKIPKSHALTVQMMDSTWGAGNPRRNMPKGAHGLGFDNHRYLTYSNVPVTKKDYMNASCSDTFPSPVGKKSLVVGEWSLAIKQEKEWSDEFSPLNEKNHDWYTRWWAAQVRAYEKQKGWVFWSWKTELGGDWRWSYQAAVEAGIIPKDFGKLEELAKC